MSWYKEIFHAITDTPRRIAVSFKWKARARNSIQKIVETFLGIGVALWLYYLTDRPIVSALGGFGLQWIFFEWLCEPLGFAGYYWERGPRRGDKGENGGYFWLE